MVSPSKTGQSSGRPASLTNTSEYFSLAAWISCRQGRGRQGSPGRDPPENHPKRPSSILAPFVAMPFVPFVASLFLVRPGAPSSVLLLVVRMAFHLIAMFEEGDAKSKDCRRAREGRRKNNRSSKRTMPCLQDQAREALSQLGDSSTRRHAYLRRLPQMFLQFGELSTNLK